MTGRTRLSLARQVALLLVACGIGTGCGFLTLRKDIAVASQHDQEPATIRGSVASRGTRGGPFVVVVYGVSEGRVTNRLVMPEPGPFFFVVPAGKYRLAAFEDLNHDLSYQAGTEPTGVLTAPSELVLRPGDDRTGLDLVVDASAGAPIPFAGDGISAGVESNASTFDLQLGKIVNLEDPHFSDENGKLGLWHPLEFLASVGAGVYFLEEYDPNKIPVLFVHGAGGHPGNWKYLVSKLDRSRFQPWLAYYPSAPNLDRMGRALVRAIGALRVRYEFSRLIVVAHSMGGLVARSAINHASEGASAGRVVTLPAFVTISTPWNGHPGAAVGVNYAPVVAPSWGDMAPDSAFLQQLPRTALPPECEYSLLFGYRSSGIGSEANDGVVTVSSELSMPVQLQATRVIGFDESHTSILESPEVAAQLNTILVGAVIPRDSDSSVRATSLATPRTTSDKPAQN